MKLTASESVAYNSNIFAVPNGFALPSGDARGDFVSTSSYGGSSKVNWYGQQFFVDGSFGLVRYLHQVNFDSNQYSFNAGVNWVLTSRCSGTLEAAASKSPTTVLQQVGVGINNLTTISFNETAKCAFSNQYSAILNSGSIESTNSNPQDALNNSRTQFITAGIEYTNDLSDLWVLATIRGTDFTDRTQTQNTLGLVSTQGQDDLTANYVRHINPNLTLTGQLGATGVANAFSLAVPKSIVPHYLGSIAWTPTPKLTILAQADRSITPPTTIVGNEQISYNAQFNISYQVTPKVTFSTGVTASYSTAAFTPGFVGTAFTNFFSAQDVYSAQAGLTYAMTPFLAGSLNWQYSERVSDHLVTPQDLVTVSLNYKPF